MSDITIEMGYFQRLRKCSAVAADVAKELHAALQPPCFSGPAVGTMREKVFGLATRLEAATGDGISHEESDRLMRAAGWKSGDAPSEYVPLAEVLEMLSEMSICGNLSTGWQVRVDAFLAKHAPKEEPQS